MSNSINAVTQPRMLTATTTTTTTTVSYSHTYNQTFGQKVVYSSLVHTNCLTCSPGVEPGAFQGRDTQKFSIEYSYNQTA